MADNKGGLQFSFWSRFYDGCTRLIGYGNKFRIENLRVAGIDASRPLRVLDVGCGTGELAMAVAAHSAPGSTITGIDPVPAMLEIAKRKRVSRGMTKHGAVDISFKQGTIERLAFESNTFDVVLCTMVVHHLNRVLKYSGFKEIWRVLKPGGAFIIADFGIPTQHGSLSFVTAVKLGLFLYFNFMETIAGNFTETIVDHFTGILPALLEYVGFERVIYVQSSFKRAIFIKSIKPDI
nr:class I SAM-dependent methyltransferase [Candidatus Sigynarchaeota archaeon]